MSDHGHPTSRELHAAHADERNRVGLLARHEDAVRAHERERILGHLGVPMDEDDTGFCPGGKV